MVVFAMFGLTVVFLSVKNTWRSSYKASVQNVDSSFALRHSDMTNVLLFPYSPKVLCFAVL